MKIEKVQVVRAFWGNTQKLKLEVSQYPLHNEVVYVWGLENQKFLLNRGYRTILMSKQDHEFEEIRKFSHKIRCFKRASDDWKEFLFLDWDVKPIEFLDEEFYQELRKKDFQMPTYSYPIEYLHLYDKLEDESARNWTNLQIQYMKKYSWIVDDMVIMPNACFVYSNRSEMPDKLLEMDKLHELKTVGDEFSMLLATNCNFTDYVKKYEPHCIFGRPRDTIFILDDIHKNTEEKLHSLISKIQIKREYFLHK